MRLATLTLAWLAAGCVDRRQRRRQRPRRPTPRRGTGRRSRVLRRVGVRSSRPAVPDGGADLAAMLQCDPLRQTGCPRQGCYVCVDRHDRPLRRGGARCFGEGARTQGGSAPAAECAVGWLLHHGRDEPLPPPLPPRRRRDAVRAGWCVSRPTFRLRGVQLMTPSRDSRRSSRASPRSAAARARGSPTTSPRRRARRRVVRRRALVATAPRPPQAAARRARPSCARAPRNASRRRATRRRAPGVRGPATEDRDGDGHRAPRPGTRVRRAGRVR